MARNPQGDDWRKFLDSFPKEEGLSRSSEEIQWIFHEERDPIIELRESAQVLGHTKPYEELSQPLKKIVDRARGLGYRIKQINQEVIQEGTLYKVPY